MKRDKEKPRRKKGVRKGRKNNEALTRNDIEKKKKRKKELKS